MIQFPERAYFQVFSSSQHGWVFREVILAEAGNIEMAAASVDDDTVSFHLIELGIITDASEDVAAKWMQINRGDIDIRDGEAVVPQFIRDHAPDLIADLEGEIAVAALNNRHHNEHEFARAS